MATVRHEHREAARRILFGDIRHETIAQAIADAEERGEKRAAMSAEDLAVVVEALRLRHYELDRCDGCGGDCPSKMAAIERVLKGMGEVV